MKGFSAANAGFSTFGERGAWWDSVVDAFFEVRGPFDAFSSLGVFKLRLKPAFHHDPHKQQPHIHFLKVFQVFYA